MTDARLRLFWHRAGPFAAVTALVAAGAASQGCGGSSGTGGSGSGGGTPTSSTTGSPTSSTTGSPTSSTTGSPTSSTTGSPTSSTTTGMGGSTGTGGSNACANTSFMANVAPGANGGFSDAFDAAPDANATTVYFTGLDMNGNPGVFKETICPTAGTVSAVYTGGAFEAPFGIAISSDDTTLFVADLSAAEDPTDITKDKGVLFSLPSAGGTAPTILVGSVAPRGVTVVPQSGKSDVVYFTGIDKSNGLAGVFSVSAQGGAVTTIAEGAPFNDPAGVYVTKNGDVYVLDTSASGNLATIILVASGSSTATDWLGSQIQVGYPAGFTSLVDESQFLISGMTFPGAENDALIQIDTGTKAATYNTMNIGTFSEAAGLHRALSTDVFAWADTKATPMGMSGTGTVFVIK